MNGGSPRTPSGKDSNLGKGTLLGSLVRRVSRSGKNKEKSSRVKDEGQEPSSSSSLGYRRVTPNVAPSSMYPSSSPPSSSHHERIVWGRPPATSTEGRIIEGIQLVDEGPSQKPGSSHPLRQVQRVSSRSRHRTPREEEKPDLQRRRSIDSLFSSMNVYVPLLPHQDKTSATAAAANGPRRAVSVRVDGSRNNGKPLGRINSISSTPRAKPAQEIAIPPRQSSPFQGTAAWTPECNNSGGYVDSVEEQRLRQAYKGRGAVWAVARGWKRGIVETFEEAEQQTRGFPGPIMRQFESIEEALDYLKAPSSQGIRSQTSEDKVASAGVPFDSVQLQRQHPQQQQQHHYASPEQTHDGAIRRTIKSPATNPFLAEADRNMNGHRSFSTGSTSNNVHTFTSPRFVSQRPPVSRNASSNDARKTTGFLLPPPVISNNSNSSYDSNTAAKTVRVTSIVLCQDLEPSISFYRDVLGFTIDADHRYKGEVVMRHQSTQMASLTLRVRSPTSPSTSKRAPSPSGRIPLSMYRSSIMLNVGHCDMHQLYADISSKLLSFQSNSHSLTTTGSTHGHSRIEEIEIKVRSGVLLRVFR
jgi:hypothetical protein